MDSKTIDQIRESSNKGPTALARQLRAPTTTVAYWCDGHTSAREVKALWHTRIVEIVADLTANRRQSGQRHMVSVREVELVIASKDFGDELKKPKRSSIHGVMRTFEGDARKWQRSRGTENCAITPTQSQDLERSRQTW